MTNELGYLAKLTLCPGLFFASTAVIPGGDGGGGDAGDMGGGDAGDGEVVQEDGGDEAGDAGEIGDEVSSEGSDSEDDEGVSEESDEHTEGKPARTASEEIKKALDKLRATDPEAAKVLRKQFFKQEQALNGYRESFKTPDEAVAARDLIETFGGETGLTELKQEAEDYATEITQFAEGNPGLINELASKQPKGLVKITPHAVSRMKQIDAAAYTQRIAAPGTVDVLNMTSSSLSGMTPLHAIERAIELIGDGKQKEAHALVSGIKQWAADVAAYAKSTQTAGGGDEEETDREKAIREREQGVQRERQELVNTQASNVIMSRLNRVVEQHLAPYLKKAKLTPQQRKATNNGVRNRITTMLRTEPKYQAPLKAALAKGDMRAIGRLVGSWASMKGKKAMEAEWAERGYGGTKTATNGNGRASVSAVSTKPRMEDVDWSKDPRRLRYTGDGTTGEYTDKKGNVRRFKW